MPYIIDLYYLVALFINKFSLTRFHNLADNFKGLYFVLLTWTKVNYHCPWCNTVNNNILSVYYDINISHIINIMYYKRLRWQYKNAEYIANILCKYDA